MRGKAQHLQVIECHFEMWTSHMSLEMPCGGCRSANLIDGVLMQ